MNERQFAWDTLFINFARDVAMMSYAMRLKVGAVAVRDRRVIALGYNGTPAGEDNCCEDWVTDKETGVLVSITKPSVIHAEKNLILFCKDNDIDLRECTLYLTHSPCLPCSELVVNAGIRRIVYEIHYRVTEHLTGLGDLGVKVQQWKP